MRTPKKLRIRTLAVQIDCRGFGYTILEGKDWLVDWGVKQTTGPGQARTIEVVADLIAQYRPNYILLEDLINQSHRRSPRAVLLTRSIVKFLVEHGQDCRLVPADLVKRTFQRWGAHTKQERANQVCRLLPVLASRLPPPRKPWMSEDSRMSIFSAASLAITFLDALLGQKPAQRYSRRS